MLGVKREEHKAYVKHGQQSVIDEHTIEMTTTPYVDGVYEGWKDYISPNHKPSTPFPQNLTLTKNHTVDPSETQRVLVRGYNVMTVVGKLLWVTRGLFPECHNVATTDATNLDHYWRSPLRRLGRQQCTWLSGCASTD